MRKLTLVAALSVLNCVACGQASGLSDSPMGGVRSANLNICSKLDLNGLTWPANLSPSEQSVFALALNLSGSFEGPDGWRNITNNFDGEGLSLGLLNQCLGEGSLQPLLIDMTANHPDLMQQYFVGVNFDSLKQMLAQWQKAGFNAEKSAIEPGFSALDDDEAIRLFRAKATPKPAPKAETPNQVSVDWAVKTIYLDGKGLVFQPAWIEGLSVMSDSGEYRSLQVAKAYSLYQGAMALFKHFKTTQIRSFLFFFDLMVQNGGISGDVQTAIDTILKKKNYSETDKLEQILLYRLKFVRKAFVADVKARKESIINGQGFVHGFNRNYNVEYCATLNSLLFPDAPEIENFLTL